MNGFFWLRADLADKLGNTINDPNLQSLNQFTVKILTGPAGAVLTNTAVPDGQFPDAPDMLGGFQVSEPGAYTFEIDDLTTAQSVSTTPILLSTTDLTPPPASAFAGLHLISTIQAQSDGTLSIQAQYEDAAGNFIPDMTLASSAELTVSIASGPDGAQLISIDDPNADFLRTFGEECGYVKLPGYGLNIAGTYTFEFVDSAASTSSVSAPVEFDPASQPPTTPVTPPFVLNRPVLVADPTASSATPYLPMEFHFPLGPFFILTAENQLNIAIDAPTTGTIVSTTLKSGSTTGSVVVAQNPTSPSTNPGSWLSQPTPLFNNATSIFDPLPGS